MSEKTPKSKAPEKRKPFPWHCIECGKDEIVPKATDYATTVKHDGRPYTIRVSDLPIPTCANCGEQVFTSAVDDRVVAALRVEVGLLAPDEIHERRRSLNLNQQELAEQLGVAKETISRWETGALIQSRAMDNLLRLYFESEEVREMLKRRFKPAAHNRVTNWKHTEEADYKVVSSELFSRN